MSDTPLTDEASYVSSRYDGEEIPGFDYVEADFARDLERQRNELLASLKLTEQYLVERGVEFKGFTGRTIVLPAIRSAIAKVKGSESAINQEVKS